MDQNFRPQAILVLLSSLIGLLVTACAPSASDHPSATRATLLQPFSTPTLMEKEGVNVVMGGVSGKLESQYDATTRVMKVEGPFEVAPYGGGTPIKLDLRLIGTMSPGAERVTLRAAHELPAGMNIAAKATCLDAAGGCSTAFIDIYVQYQKHIYHHQIATRSDKNTPPKETKKPLPTIADLDKENDLKPPQLDDNNEPIEDDDETEEDEGRYVGDIRGDLKELFEDEAAQPKPTPKPSASVAPSASPAPKASPTPKASLSPTPKVTPKVTPTVKPSVRPTVKPTATPVPSVQPSVQPSVKPSPAPKATVSPSATVKPTVSPTPKPTVTPKPSATPRVTPKPLPTVKIEPKETPKTLPTIKPDQDDEPARENEKPKDLGNLNDVNRKISQVIGSVSEGFLKNALSLFDLQRKSGNSGFYISRPELKTYYGSNELIYLMQKMAKFTLAQDKNYSVRVGDLSKEKGGTIFTTRQGQAVAKHRSHKNGTDADVSYYFKDQADQGQKALNADGSPRSDWLMERQWELFKELTSTRLVDRIFVHRKIKKALCQLAIAKQEIKADTTQGVAFETLWRLQPRPSDHADHFHLRVKCSSIQLSCLVMPDPPRTTGCF